MFEKFFSKRKTITDDVMITTIVTQTSALINNLHHQMDLRFKEVSAQIKELELGLTQMETKLLTKDLKDKQAYGLLHYKLHESKNPKLSEEISDLETQLNIKKNALKDH